MHQSADLREDQEYLFNSENARLFREFAERAIADVEPQMDLDHSMFERLCGNSAQFRRGLIELTERLASRNSFVDQVTPQMYGIEIRAKDPVKQVEILRGHFPGYNLPDPSESPERNPFGANGCFAIPTWMVFGDTYAEAVESVMSKLAEVLDRRPVPHFQIREVRPHGLRTDGCLHRILGRQARPVLLLTAQLGSRHAGKSAQRAVETFTTSEFGLGLCELAIALLTHPEALEGIDREIGFGCTGHEIRNDNLGRAVAEVLMVGPDRFWIEKPGVGTANPYVGWPTAWMIA